MGSCLDTDIDPFPPTSGISHSLSSEKDLMLFRGNGEGISYH